MKLKYSLALSIVIFLIGCKSTDPFTTSNQSSSLLLAQDFFVHWESPVNEDSLKQAYEKLALKTKIELSFGEFLQRALRRYPKGQIEKTVIEVEVFDKYELQNGEVLVYFLERYDPKMITGVFQKYAIKRIHLLPASDGSFAVYIKNPDEFVSLPVIAEGEISALNSKRVGQIHDAVSLDSRQFDFQREMELKPSAEDDLVDRCIRDGEELYDQEEYRKALIQFQKALGIDPDNEKAKTYVNRCKKALSLGLSQH